MRLVIRLSVVVVLLALELSALFAALHPTANGEYRAYYIDRTADEWRPVHYKATPDQGMVLAHEGLPEFVKSTHGFYDREAWGRWTRAQVARVLMNRQFRGRTCVIVEAWPSVAQLGKRVEVVFGTESRPMELTNSRPTDYYLDFKGLQGTNVLEFLLAELPPKDSDVRKGSGDARRLGVAISLIRFMDGPCEAASDKRP